MRSWSLGSPRDPALSFNDMPEEDALAKEFNRGPSNGVTTRLNAAQEEAADDFADRDYYMFESKNTNLNADRNPESNKPDFMGPGNKNDTVKAAPPPPPYHPRCTSDAAGWAAVS